jgi:hypothetical protein
MTIAMLHVAPQFALVAADQRFSVWIVRDGQRVEVHGDRLRRADGSLGPFVKVQAHSTLPIVWVCTGLGTVPHDGKQVSTNHLINRALDDFEGPIEEVPSAFGFLEPLVLEELRARPESFAGETDPGLGILLGIYLHGSAEGGVLRFGNEPKVQPLQHGGVIVGSSHTSRFINSLPDEELYPRPGSTADEAAAQMRQLLRRAIEAAQELAGKDADVGGDVDVAMVGPEGAKVLTLR